jgi:hypothetical protein
MTLWVIHLCSHGLHHVPLALVWTAAVLSLLPGPPWSLLRPTHWAGLLRHRVHGSKIFGYPQGAPAPGAQPQAVLSAAVLVLEGRPPRRTSGPRRISLTQGGRWPKGSQLARQVLYHDQSNASDSIGNDPRVTRHWTISLRPPRARARPGFLPRTHRFGSSDGALTANVGQPCFEHRFAEHRALPRPIGSFHRPDAQKPTGSDHPRR